MNPLCSCSLEIEDALHYLFYCHHFNHIRIELMNSVKSVKDKKDILLYGDSLLDRIKNKFILQTTVTYINNANRFCGSLFE